MPQTLCDGLYTREAALGAGASGEAFLARHVSGQQVVIKHLSELGEAALPAFWAERTALRLANIPDAVALLDDFEEGGHQYLVMERALGEPFCGASSWAELEPAAWALVVAVAGLHTHGITHADLKPDNVFLHCGRVTLLDLGLAVSGASVVNHGACGSSGYAPPEQLHEGVRNPRVDVFAIATMIIERLTGRTPGALNERKQAALTRTLSRLLPTPELVAALVSAVAEDPEGRPRDALALVEAFSDRVSPFKADFLIPQLPEHASVEELERRCFVEDHRVALLGRDAARVLHARTAGRRDRVVRELTAWLRAGVARKVGDRLLLDPLAVAGLLAGRRLPVDAYPTAPEVPELPAAEEQVLGAVRELAPEANEATLGALLSEEALREGLPGLEARGLIWRTADGWSTEQGYATASRRAARDALGDGSSRRLLLSLELAEAGEDDLAAARAAEEVSIWARGELEAGRLRLVPDLVVRATRLARRAEAGELEQRLLTQLFAWCVVINTLESCEIVMSTVEEQGSSSVTVRAIASLLRVRRARLRRELDRACKVLNVIEISQVEEEEVLRDHMRMKGQLHGLRARNDVTQWLWERRAWARQAPGRQAIWRDWLALSLYLQRRYEASIYVYKNTERRAAPAHQRLSAQINYILALMDAGHLPAALQVAQRTAELARALRRPMIASAAGRFCRMIRVHLGQSVVPDEGWVREASLVSQAEVAWAAWTEALAAWSVHQRHRALRLAREARRVAASLNLEHLVTLTNLICFVQGRRPPEEEREAWLRRALHIDPVVGVQMWVVLWPEVPVEHHERLRAVLDSVPPEKREPRYGIWSAAACERRVWPDPPSPRRWRVTAPAAAPRVVVRPRGRQ